MRVELTCLRNVEAEILAVALLDCGIRCEYPGIL